MIPSANQRHVAGAYTYSAIARIIDSQITIATTYYLHLPLSHVTYDIWQRSCDSVWGDSGIIWSVSFQPIVPLVIEQSPFLQDAIPTLPGGIKPIVVVQLTGTWKDLNDTAAIKAIGLKLINDVDVAARTEYVQTGWIYLNYAHAGQNVFGEGRREEWLQKVISMFEPEDNS